MKFERKHLFWVFWGAAALAAAAIYLRYETNSDFIGLVENRIHALGVTEAGRVAKIHVAQGQAVKAGQVLVELDTSDLDSQKVLLQSELDRQEARLEANRARYGLEYDKLVNQSAADSLNMSLKQTDLVEKKAELESVRTEIDRLQNAEKAGLGRSRDLSDLIIRRDTLSRVIAAQSAVLSGKGGPKRTGEAQADVRDAVVESMLGADYEKINEIKVNLQLVESRRAMRTILSPADGRVVMLVNNVGDTVDRYVPVVTVEEAKAAYLDAYVPETSGQAPMVGGRVNLYPHRQMAPASTGVIVAVDPGYSPIPDRISFQGRIYWARKFRVQIDPRHALMPGEAVRVEMVGGTIGVTDAIANAVDHGPAPEPAPDVQTVPEEKGVESQPAGTETAGAVPSMGASVLPKIRYLPARGFTGSFEPSGIVWLADIERYLIVSDDTGAGDNRHAPWVFLMDASGAVDPEPVVLKGTDRLNDLEAVTAAPDGSLYLVSSNNVNKKGVRKPVRQQLIKVERYGRDFRVVGSAALFDGVTASYDAKAIEALGLGNRLSGGQLELNIEGAAWDLTGGEPAILFGLKQPVGPAGSYIWRLKDPDSFIKSGRLQPGQLRLWGTVDLGVFKGRRASISDIMVTGDGKLYATSTIPLAPDSDQLGRLFRLDRDAEGRLKATALVAYPGLKPEGVCTTGGDSYTVVMDTGDAPSMFHTGKWAR